MERGESSGRGVAQPISVFNVIQNPAGLAGGSLPGAPSPDPPGFDIRRCSL